ncbi:DUF362 domain-containing protein [Mycoplasmatota bacterium]|nr:DUF362 domain-containing protein [Mycoplasmatota bacterium]
MKNVYFKDISCDTNKSEIAKILLKTVISKEEITLKGEVPIKVHFGEKGNITFIKAEDYDGIIDYLQENNISTSFIETNVLYVGSRTIKERHIKTAEEHNFTRIPIIIADGEYGEDYNTIKINKEFFDEALIGREFSNFDQFIVCSHFKGHILAGFGGAIKQLSMGFASRGGKLAMHSLSVPAINPKICTGCGICEEKCPSSAIEVRDLAVINNDKCIGCAACISHCPEHSISIDWNNNANFLEKLAEYAYAAQRDKEVVYITFVTNITDNCDCLGVAMEPVIKDIGMFASTDPVALDKACFDLVTKEKNTAPDSNLWKYFDRGNNTLKHAEKIGLGATKYKIIKI